MIKQDHVSRKAKDILVALGQYFCICLMAGVLLISLYIQCMLVGFALEETGSVPPREIKEKQGHLFPESASSFYFL